MYLKFRSVFCDRKDGNRAFIKLFSDVISLFGVFDDDGEGLNGDTVDLEVIFLFVRTVGETDDHVVFSEGQGDLGVKPLHELIGGRAFEDGDGIGGDHFYHQLADEPDISKTMAQFLSRGRDATVPDQWQTQILLRILGHAKVIYVSKMPDEIVEQMHMIPAHSLAAAIKKAKQIVGDGARIAAIPDGVSVMVVK